MDEKVYVYMKVDGSEFQIRKFSRLKSYPEILRKYEIVDRNSDTLSFRNLNTGKILKKSHEYYLKLCEYVRKNDNFIGYTEWSTMPNNETEKTQCRFRLVKRIHPNDKDWVILLLEYQMKIGIWTNKETEEFTGIKWGKKETKYILSEHKSKDTNLLSVLKTHIERERRDELIKFLIEKGAKKKKICEAFDLSRMQISRILQCNISE